MRKEIDKYELIEAYLKGSLSDSQKELVEDRMASDKEFSEEVSRHRELFLLIEDHSFLDIRDRIKDIHSNYSSSPGFNGKGRIYLPVIIALVISSLVIMILLYRKQPQDIGFTEVRPDVNVETKIYNKDTLKIPTNRDKIPTVAFKQPKAKIIRKGNLSKEEKIVSESIEKSLKEILVKNDSIPGQKLKLPKHKSDSVPLVPLTDSNSTKDKLHAISDPKNLPTTQDKCKEVKITADVVTVKSCDEKPTGQIVIDPKTIEGGVPPYEISIDNGKNFYSSLLFENLYASIYNISIKDRNNCTSKLGSYRVDGKECSYSFAFAPEKGESWEIPNQGGTGKIRIFNISGTLVYQAILDFPGTYKWYGKSNAGNGLPMGAYQFILELDDDINPLIGNVTIVR